MKFNGNIYGFHLTTLNIAIKFKNLKYYHEI